MGCRLKEVILMRQAPLARIADMNREVETIFNTWCL